MNNRKDHIYEMPVSGSVSSVQVYMTRVFNLMAAGLGISGLASLIALSIPAFTLLLVKGLFWFFIIAELVVVVYLMRKIRTMAPASAMKWFFIYSAMNGLTLAPVFLLYTRTTVVSAFFICAGMFGGMAIWGATTRKDLSSIGAIASMGLLGLIIASVVNLFIGSSGFQLILSYIGVAVFTGLTAYDVQTIRMMALREDETGGSMAVMGALKLYLDFINLFLQILYILGGRR
ncbi:MAG: Bax inhibitor-1/YccA family protein, partial [Candidatus Aureabacteria bacterium]|nr:Bax inhibitor-1/YccA family protein [Candidatus Auribacterota bacterium]